MVSNGSPSSENRIDFSVLPDVTEDLEKLGVLLGDRRKILCALADLKPVEKSSPQVAKSHHQDSRQYSPQRS
jgi:hypothetical protein